MILCVFTVAKAILEVRFCNLQVERNTQRFVIIVLGTAAVKLPHKSEGSIRIRFFRFPRDEECTAVDSSTAAFRRVAFVSIEYTRICIPHFVLGVS